MLDGMRKIRAGIRVVHKGGSRLRAMVGRKPAIGYISSLHDGNMGDLACYEAARRLFHGHRLVPIGIRYDERRLAHVGLSAEKVCDGIVMGGGSLVDHHRLPLLQRLAATNVPLYIFGSGAGPVGTEPEATAMAGWGALADRFRVVGVRAEDSKRRLDRLGFHNVRVVGDLALGLATPHPAAIPKKSRIGLFIAKPERGVYGEGMYSAFPEIEKALAAMMRDGHEIVPCFIEPKDQAVYATMRGRLPHPPPAGRYIASLDALMDRIASCTMVISVRLHGSVLASTLGVPSIALGYGPKCLEFQRFVGREQFHQKLAEVDASWLLNAVAQCAETTADGRRQIWSHAGESKNRLQQLADEISHDLDRASTQAVSA
jgi:polysaccharide pyruvyl transferase WcaK-like protein